MRALLTLTLALTILLFGAPLAAAGDRPSLGDRVEELQQEMDSLIEDVDDLGEPVEEFELFDQCAYAIGVSQYGSLDGATGFLYGSAGRHRPALALDIRGFGLPQFEFLAFPAEEPPSIECNEDAGQEDIDD